MLIAILLHSVTSGRTDPYRCKSLFNGGSWPPEGAFGDGQRQFARWEPSDCRMHEYTRDQFKDCLRNRRVVFIGDSTTREIFWSAVTRLDHFTAERELLETFVSENPQRDLKFDVEGVHLEFIWDPWLNSTGLREELKTFRRHKSSTRDNESKQDESAALVILGAPGLFAARHGGDDYFALFRKAVDSVRPFLRKPLAPTASLTGKYEELGNQILLAPVQIPAYDKLYPERRKTITPSRIDRMNHYLNYLPATERTHVLWAYNEMTNQAPNGIREDGFHVFGGVTDRRIDMALNARCNSGLVKHGFEGERTCCVPYTSAVGGQIGMLLVAALIIPFFHWAQRPNNRSIARYLPSGDILNALTVLVGIAVICFLADKTQLLSKAEKYRDRVTLVVLCIVLGVISGVSYRQSASQLFPSTSEKGRALDSDDPGFMSRDVSNEWKGWMMVFVLLLNFQYTDNSLWPYKLFTLASSAYIFLSTFGHASYFLKTDDFSLRRFTIVLLRVNILSWVLGYALNVNWPVYSFPRLISFWFIVTYVVLRTFKRFNHSPTHLFVKVVASALIITVLVQAQGPLEVTGRILNTFWATKWDVREIRTQFSTHRFIPYFGILAAGLSHRFSTLRNDTQPTTKRATGFLGNVDRAMSLILSPNQFTAPLQLIIIALSLLSIGIVSEVVRRVEQRDRFESFNAFTSLLQIIPFAILRNCHSSLRKHYLAIPATLSKAALEVYLLQKHIFLSGDGTGLLRTGLWRRNAGFISSAGWMLETVLLVIVLLFVSSHVHDTTQTICAWIVGEEEPDLTGRRRRLDVESGSVGLARRTGLLGGRLTLQNARVRVGVIVLLFWLWNVLYR